jgi:hypothetical protein
MLLDDLDDYGTKGPGGIEGFLLQPVAWHKDARCAEPDVDPEIFYVERGQTSKAARAVCAQCPVRDRCLDFALNDPDAWAWGIWGGDHPTRDLGISTGCSDERLAPRASKD